MEITNEKMRSYTFLDDMYKDDYYPNPEKGNMRVYEKKMKNEYDFSHGERGKFFRKGAALRLPVYLDGKAMKFVSARARLRKTDISTIVNELIHNDIRQADQTK